MLPTLVAKSLRVTLEKAYKVSQEACYVAEITLPCFPEFEDIQKVIYYRKIEEDGTVLLRADFQGTARLLFSFLANRNGQFAIDASTGMVWKGGDFMRLFWLESLLNRPFHEELAHAEYSDSTVNWNGRTVHRIVMRIPDEVGTEDGPPVSAFTGFCVASDVDQRRLHPFVREYMIDIETGVILSLRKFNAKGQLLSVVDLGKVDFHPVWEESPGLFETPLKICGRVANTVEFREKMRRKKNLHPRHFVKRDALIRNWQFILTLFGCSCIVGAFILHRVSRSN